MSALEDASPTATDDDSHSPDSIEIEVLLPPNYDNSVFLEMPQNVTVERIKWAALALIEDFPSELFPSFLLGISESDLLNVEFVRFETCHPAISRTLEMGQVMTLFLVPHVTSEQKRDLNSRLTMMRKKCLSKPAASSSSRDLLALRSKTDEAEDTPRSIASSSDDVANSTGSKSASRRTVRRSQSFSSDLPQFLADRESPSAADTVESPLPVPEAVPEDVEEPETPPEASTKGSQKRLVRAQSSLFNCRPKSTMRSKLVNSHRESPIPSVDKSGRFAVKVVLDNSTHVVLQTEQKTQQEFARGMITKLQMMISLLENGYLLDAEHNAILGESDLVKPLDKGIDDGDDDEGDGMKTFRLLRPDSGHSPSNRRLSDTPERWNVSRGTQRMKTIALGFQRTNFSPKELFKSEKLAGVQIGSLIGRPLCWGNAPSDPTIQSFRTQVVRRLEQYHNVQYEKITRAPVAKYPLLSSVELPMHFNIHFWHHDTCHVTEVSCDLDLTVLEALARMKKKNAADIVVEKEFVYDKMVVKIQGTNEFILERGRLIDIVSVRTDLQCKRTPTFVLVPYGVLQAKLNLFLSAEQRQAEVQFENRVALPPQYTRVSEVVDPFEVRVVALEMSTPPAPTAEEKLLYVECTLWHGEETLCEPVRTPSKPFSSLLYLHATRFTLPTRDIPKAARLSLTVWEENRNGGKDELFAWAVLQLVDFKNEMLSGPQHLSLWTTPNLNTHHAPTPCPDSPYTLIFELPRLSLPVVYIPSTLPPSQEAMRTSTQPSAKEQAILDHVLSGDCLYEMTQREKQTIWKWRLHLRAQPNSLGFIVRAVSWHVATQVARLHHLLLDWPAMDPYPALALLDFCFMDERVRTFAVQCLKPLTSAQVSELMLQFVQVLKYEPYHDSSLARFLLHRALVDKGTVGHAFFWNLRSEILVTQFAERFSLLAETYLRCCDEHRGELVKQVEMVSKLRRIALAIQKVPLPKRNDVLREQIKSTHLKSDVQIPSNPHISVQSLLIDRCKAKDSFTAPLWLEWKLNDWTPRDVTRPMIFKVGDDLRQDSLSLQAIRLMDHIWKSNGLDFHMSTYNVLATGDCMGFIEVVRDASSIADIQKGAGGAAAAISKIPLQRWLLKHNPTDEEYDTAVRKFTYSCAGYSVASYILGLGDRHNDNIMVTKAGQLFHIDFAHFMGNIMKWKGIKRETAPFVLTPEIAYVMGGEKGKAFKKFTSACCEAFNILRKEADMFLTLFLLMRHTGIPQLSSKVDVEYMRKAFMLDLSDEQASEAFQKLIAKCLSSLATRANFLIHILAHPDKD